MPALRVCRFAAVHMDSLQPFGLIHLSAQDRSGYPGTYSICTGAPESPLHPRSGKTTGPESRPGALGKTFWSHLKRSGTKQRSQTYAICSHGTAPIPTNHLTALLLFLENPDVLDFVLGWEIGFRRVAASSPDGQIENQRV